MLNLVKMTVPGRPEFIQVCKSAAIAAANLAKFDIDTVDEIGMAVFEACKSITCHGHDCWCSMYDMEIELADDHFTIKLISTGEHNVEKCGHICLDCPREGDLGISIIKSIMDEVEIDKDGDGTKKIIMVKKIC